MQMSLWMHWITDRKIVNRQSDAMQSLFDHLLLILNQNKKTYIDVDDDNTFNCHALDL